MSSVRISIISNDYNSLEPGIHHIFLPRPSHDNIKMWAAEEKKTEQNKVVRVFFLLLCRPRNPFLRSLVLYHYLIFFFYPILTTSVRLYIRGYFYTHTRTLIYIYTAHKACGLFPRKARLVDETDRKITLPHRLHNSSSLCTLSLRP